MDLYHTSDQYEQRINRFLSRTCKVPRVLLEILEIGIEATSEIEVIKANLTLPQFSQIMRYQMSPLAGIIILCEQSALA